MSEIKKKWDDLLLFYGGEALILLICEGVIIYFTYEGPSSIPFCIGMAITALVAGIAMHWALTKYTRRLVVAGYFVWLGVTLIVGLTAGILFTAYDRTKQHDKAITQKLEKAKTEAAIEREKSAQGQQNDLAAKLAMVDQLQGMLAGAKTQRDRNNITALGKVLVTATPTPTPLPQDRAKAAISLNAGETKPADPKAGEAAPEPEEWHPFPAGTFFRWWHDDVTRMNGMLGVVGLAILLGVFLTARGAESAAQVALAGATTTHTVTTNGPTHSQPVGFNPPLTGQQPVTAQTPGTNPNP